jgi:hypothetical protein
MRPVLQKGMGHDEAKKVSLGGEVYTGIIEPGYVNRGSGLVAEAVYELAKRFTRLTATVGIPDDYRNVKVGGFKIYVDGELVDKGVVTPGKNLPIKVDVEDGKSLKIEISDCAFLQPKLYGGKAAATSNVRLKSPDDAAKVSGSVELKWSDVENAVAYGIEIISVTVDSADESNDRFFGYTVKGGRTATTIDLSKFAPGKYRWSVIAFGDKKMLGSFSQERTFIVGR